MSIWNWLTRTFGTSLLSLIIEQSSFWYKFTDSYDTGSVYVGKDGFHMRQLTSIHQQIDHKIRIEGSRRSQELKPVSTRSAGEPFLDAHFQHLSWISPVDSIIILDLSYKSTRHRPISKNKSQSGPPCWVARFGNFQSWLHYLSEIRLSENLKSDEDGNEL